MMDRYSATTYSGERSYSLQASRGCPYDCGYCYNSVVNERRWRPFPIDHVLANLELLVEKYGARTIYFVDDNACVSHERFGTLLTEIARRNYGINLAFQGLRVDDILRFDAETLDLLRQAGVRSLDVGVERRVASQGHKVAAQ